MATVIGTCEIGTCGTLAIESADQPVNAALAQKKAARRAYLRILGAGFCIGVTGLNEDD
jgi:hypothetical protein